MAFVAGLDFDSENVWLALIDEDTAAVMSISRHVLAGQDSFDRARKVRDALPHRWRWLDDGVVAVGVEEPYSPHRPSLRALLRVQGAILSCLPAELLVASLTPNGRAPAGWKALIGLPTNASKPMIAARVVELGAEAGLRQDFYDAIGIAHATRNLWLQRTTIAA